MSTPRTKVREAPRISVNGLAEYLVAGAGQRRRIIEQQKRPRTFQVAYYREAEEAICSFLLSEGRDADLLKRAVLELRTGTGEKEWEVSRRQACVEAIGCIQRAVSEIPLAGLEIKRGSNTVKPLVISGVTVSVRPELLLCAEREGARRIGAVKLFFSKTEAVTEEQARYAGTLVQQHMETTYPRVGTADYHLCFVLDVLGQKVFRAPGSYKRRRNDEEAACEEIGRAWASA